MALIQIDGIVKNPDIFQFAWTDILIVVILIGFPIIKIILCKLVIDNYQAL